VLSSGEWAMAVMSAPDYLARHEQPERPSEWAGHRCMVPVFNVFSRWTIGCFSKRANPPRAHIAILSKFYTIINFSGV